MSVAGVHWIPKALFPQILKQTRVNHTPFLSLRVANLTLEKKDKPPHFAIIISSKVAKKAVERNLWKRRGRAVIREWHQGVKDNHYCLLYLKTETMKLSFKEFKSEIINIFKKANLFK